MSSKLQIQFFGLSEADVLDLRRPRTFRLSLCTNMDVDPDRDVFTLCSEPANRWFCSSVEDPYGMCDECCRSNPPPRPAGFREMTLDEALVWEVMGG